MSSPGNEPTEYPTRSDLPPVPSQPTAPMQPTPAPEAPSAGRAEPAPGFTDSGRVKNTRTSGVWIGLIATAVFLILLIDFIAQNSRKVSIHFFGWHGQFSLALTILFSAVVGVILVAVPGTVRILQLRRALRKNGPGRK